MSELKASSASLFSLNVSGACIIVRKQFYPSSEQGREGAYMLEVDSMGLNLKTYCDKFIYDQLVEGEAYMVSAGLSQKDKGLRLKNPRFEIIK